MSVVNLVSLRVCLEAGTVSAGLFECYCCDESATHPMCQGAGVTLGAAALLQRQGAANSKGTATI